MKRREFIIALGGAAATWPLRARAQEVGRVYRLGALHPLPRPAAQFAPLFDGLRRQGFIEGRNLAVDARGFGSRPDRYKDILAEIVGSSVDAIFCGGDGAMRAAREATQTVPIVGVADDM